LVLWYAQVRKPKQFQKLDERHRERNFGAVQINILYHPPTTNWSYCKQPVNKISPSGLFKGQLIGFEFSFPLHLVFF